MNKCDHLLLERHPTPALCSIHMFLYTYIGTVSTYTYVCVCIVPASYSQYSLREGPPSGVETMAPDTGNAEQGLCGPLGLFRHRLCVNSVC